MFNNHKQLPDNASKNNLTSSSKEPRLKQPYIIENVGVPGIVFREKILIIAP